MAKILELKSILQKPNQGFSIGIEISDCIFTQAISYPKKKSRKKNFLMSNSILSVSKDIFQAIGQVNQAACPSPLPC
jgi:hypothetical protein